MSITARLRIERADFRLAVDLELPIQGITGVFGPSGCGKTTLLRALAGLERGTTGYLRIGDTVWQDGAHCVPTHHRAVGYVFQEASLFPHLSVMQNLRYGMKRLRGERRRVSLDSTLELLGIGHLLKRSAAELSGGERQRVAIARALLVAPRLLLMDEPLAALDLARKREIMPYLESLHAELAIPVIYVSHSPGEIARLADHLVLLDNGRVLSSGDTVETFSRIDLPLAHNDKAAALVDATVAGHDDDYHLTYLDFPGGRFTVGRRDLPKGYPVRLRVVARDVSLTLTHQQGTSILNIFPVVVEDMAPQGDAQLIVRLSANGAPILARLTRKSAELLELAPGKSVFAQVKSVALLA